MIPVLFERDEVDFQSNGVGQLPNVIESYAYEIGNAEYELNLTYPTVNDVDGYPNSIWKELKVTERQILYKPSHSRKPHAFRIYNYEIDSIAQTITVYGRSRAYDLGNNVVKTVNINNQTPQTAMNTMKANLVEPTDFDFYSDMSTTSSTKWEHQSGLSTIMGEEGSLIQYWGGEVLRENTRISLYKRVGKDNVTTLRLGKNIQQLNYDLRTDNMVTAIIPFYRYTPEGENQEEVVVTGNTVKSSKFNNYRLPYYQFVEYNEQDDNVTNLTTLNNAASKWFSEHPNVDEPTLTINVDMMDVAESTEYAELLKSLEQVNVFDTVSVYISEYDIDVVVKVVSLKYDGFNERNLEVELGSASSGLFETFVNPQFDSISKQLNEVRKIGVTAQISADGKNTNYQGSVDPNEAGLVGDDGDIYFRTVGTEKQMWQYQVNQWNLILDTSRIDVVEKEVSTIIAQADADREAAEQNFEQAVVDAATYTNTKAQEFDNKLVAVNQEVVNVTQAANTAISKADQAIQDVGFMQTDVSTAKTNAATALENANTAKSNAGTALTNANSALTKVGALEVTTGSLQTSYNELTKTVGLKADKTTVDGINSKVTQHGLDISANATAVGLKADKSVVDSIKGTVDKHTLDIKAAADGLTLKADSSLVNTIKGTVDTHTTQISANSTAINARLTSAQVETLLTGKKYVNETTLNATATGIRADITQVSSDLSNLEIGGRNLIVSSTLLFGRYLIETNGGLGSAANHTATDFIPVVGSQSYIVSATNLSQIRVVYYDVNKGYIGGYLWAGAQGTSKIINTPSNARYVKWSGDHGNGSDLRTWKFEKGSKATDWTPAPEDMATLEKVTSIEANVNGLQTTVASKADKSQITQLSTQISTKVESATYNSKITQLDSAINLRVTKGDVTAQINVEAGVTLISNKKLLLDANTYIMGTTFANDIKAKSLEAVYADIATLKTKMLTADVITSTMVKSDLALIDKIFVSDANVNRLTAKTAFINSVKAVTISADKVTTGTLNAANVNLINVNVSSLVGNTSNFVQSAWNSAVGGGVSIAGTGVVTTASNGSQAILQNGTLLVRSAKGTAGYIGHSQSSTNDNFTLSVANGRSLQIRYSNADGTFTPLIEYLSYLDNIVLNKNTSFTGKLTINGGFDLNNYDLKNGRYIQADIIETSSIGSMLNDGNRVAVKGLSGVSLGVGGNSQSASGGFTRIMWLDSTRIYANKPLSMEGNAITNQSDARLKRNIKNTEINSLQAINSWNFVNYEWIDATKPKGMHLGLIAQDTPELMIYETDRDVYSIDSSKQTMMNSHAIQQLNRKVISIESIANDSNALAGQALSETAQLRLKVEELENKIQQMESVS